MLKLLRGMMIGLLVGVVLEDETLDVLRLCSGGYDGDVACWAGVEGQDSRFVPFMLSRGTSLMLLVGVMLENKTLEDFDSCC